MREREKGKKRGKGKEREKRKESKEEGKRRGEETRNKEREGGKRTIHGKIKKLAVLYYSSLIKELDPLSFHQRGLGK